MTFRRRITLASAAAVAVAVVLASVLIYGLTSHELHGQVDSQLRARSGEIFRGVVPFLRDRGDFGRTELGASLRELFGASPPPRLPNLGPGPNEIRGYQQGVDAAGHIVFSTSTHLPVDARTRALAAHGGRSYFSDVTLNGIHLRVLTESAGAGRALQLAQPLTDVDHLLAQLRLILVLIDAGGIALAALLGMFVAGAALAPIRRLSRATEHVAHTQDLSRRIAPTGEDELGRLAESFNGMLDALEGSMHALDASVSAQRQLVADASHELRTPVTSLRTNIEILQQAEDMDLLERRRLLADVVEQIEELTMLMNDLIELARAEDPRASGQTRADDEDVRVDLLVTDAIARARRHAPDARFEADLEETLIVAAPARLDRAINNLLDNAIKYSPPDRPIEVTLRGGELCVRDHGPGISDEDLPHIFDRFYRGAEARGRPGSGLGLAIVRQVIETHGGSISAERAPGGGTLMRLRLRTVALDAPKEPGVGTAADGAHSTAVV